MAHKTTKEELSDTLKDMHAQVEEIRQELSGFFLQEMRKLSVLDSYIFVMIREVAKLPDDNET